MYATQHFDAEILIVLDLRGKKKESENLSIKL